MAICPNYKKCSGCQLQNMEYEEQLSFKQTVLTSDSSLVGCLVEFILFAKVPKLTLAIVHPLLKFFDLIIAA